MKCKWLPILVCLFSGHTVLGQKKYCADSSIRIKYNLNYSNAQLFQLEDTSGTNIFAGLYVSPIGPGISLFKTNWGDSIYWSKQLSIPNTILSCSDVERAPAGTFICSGTWGSSNSMFLSRIDTNGNVLWAKRYRLAAQAGYVSGSSGTRSFKNINVTNNAIYLTGNFGQSWVVARLDLDGNILWSKTFWKSNSSITGSTSHAPIFYNDTLAVITNMGESSGGITIPYPVVTKLDPNTGSIYSATSYKVPPDPLFKGIFSDDIHLNQDGTASITGKMCILFYNQVIQSDMNFNLNLNRSFEPTYCSYYTSGPGLNLIGLNYTFDFNHLDNCVFLYDVNFNTDKYFVDFFRNKIVKRTRKFSLPNNPAGGSSVNLDDKENIHFTYNYIVGNSSVVEYTRLSDFAPANTVNCFGTDTSILQPVPFQITKEQFAWDNESTNILNSYGVTLTEGPQPITKQIVCKQVSYCDSVKIYGAPFACLTDPDIRYSVYRNPQCLKSISWKIDSSYADIVNTEADSAVTLHFKKCGQFFIKAIVDNCVVNDSFLVTIPGSQTDLQLTKTDSILCPGETINLVVNPEYKSYRWQDGSTQPYFDVTSPGLYSVTGVDSCGIITRDSIRIIGDNSRIQGSSSYNICVYDTVTLNLSGGITNISWQPPSFGNLRSDQLILYPTSTTTYSISAQSRWGCDLQKQVVVEVDQCPEWVRFPSAFTPNNDGLNDIFRPGLSGHLQTYELRIFNRYGQAVFISKNPYSGWDGTIKGIPQNGGVFVFMCRYGFTNKPIIASKGSFVLIR